MLNHVAYKMTKSGFAHAMSTLWLMTHETFVAVPPYLLHKLSLQQKSRMALSLLLKRRDFHPRDTCPSAMQPDYA